MPRAPQLLMAERGSHPAYLAPQAGLFSTTVCCAVRRPTGLRHPRTWGGEDGRDWGR